MWIKALRAPDGVNGTGGGSPPAGASATPTSDSMLDFDPFEPGNEPGEGGGQQTGATPPAATPPSPPEPTTGSGDAPVPPGSSPAAPPNQPADSVQQSLAAITALLREQRQQPQQPATPAQPTAPQGPRFSFTVPQQIAAQMTSEDAAERAEGLNGLVNGLANSMYAEISREMEAREQRLIRAIPTLARETVNRVQSQSEMYNDFYGRFSDLPKDPAFSQFVVLTAQQMARELHDQGKPFGWTPEFRDALGARVYATIGRQMPGAAPPAAPPRQPPPRQPFATGAGGTRGTSPQAPSPEVADIWDTMGY